MPESAELRCTLHFFSNDLRTGNNSYLQFRGSVVKSGIDRKNLEKKSVFQLKNIQSESTKRKKDTTDFCEAIFEDARSIFIDVENPIRIKRF